jgi:hypothetical protein
MLIQRTLELGQGIFIATSTAQHAGIIIAADRLGRIITQELLVAGQRLIPPATTLQQRRQAVPILGLGRGVFYQLLRLFDQIGSGNDGSTSAWSLDLAI